MSSPPQFGHDQIPPARLYLDAGEVSTYLVDPHMRATLQMVDGRILHAHLVSGFTAVDGSRFILLGEERGEATTPDRGSQ